MERLFVVLGIAGLLATDSQNYTFANGAGVEIGVSVLDSPSQRNFSLPEGGTHELAAGASGVALFCWVAGGGTCLPDELQESNKKHCRVRSGETATISYSHESRLCRMPATESS